MDKKRKGYSWVTMHKPLMVSGKSKELHTWVSSAAKERLPGTHSAPEHRITGRSPSLKLIICSVAERPGQGWGWQHVRGRGWGWRRVAFAWGSIACSHHPWPNAWWRSLEDVFSVPVTLINAAPALLKTEFEYDSSFSTRFRRYFPPSHHKPY